MREVEVDGFSDVEPLGSGGLGDVHRATRMSTGSIVAIKVLRDWSDRDVAWQRAQRELRALVDLRGHANVVQVEDVIDTDGQLAIVMEYAPGGSVVDLQQSRGGTLEFPEVLLIATHTAAALAASHSRGIIHRDIKPHNLLIGAFGNVKVCDFGIAALTRSDDVANRTSSLSLRYASPEELRGDANVGPAADIYSLAATIHQLLTGTYLPIPDGTARSVPLRNWTSPDDIPAQVDIDYRDLVVRCADPDPAKRPSADELHDRFEALAVRLGPMRCRALPVSIDVDDATVAASAQADPDADATIAASAQADPDADATIAASAQADPDADATVAAAAAVTPVDESARVFPGANDEATNVMPVGAAAAADPTFVQQSPEATARTTPMPRTAPPTEPHRRNGFTLVAFGVGIAVVIALIAFVATGDEPTDDAASPTVATAASTAAVAPPTSVSEAEPPDATTAPPATVAPTTVATDTTVASTSPATTGPADQPPLAITRAATVASFEIPASDRFDGRSFEAIDGVTFDATTGRMVAAKEVAPDDVAAGDAARVPPALFSFPADDPANVTALGTLVDASGSEYGPELDIEGLAALDDGSFVIVSEGSGELANQSEPFVVRVDATGRFVSRFELPEWLLPSEDGSSGFAEAQGPHGAVLRPGRPSEVVVVMEAPLRQDEPGIVRLTSFDVETGAPTREWSYPIDEAAIGDAFVVSMASLADGSVIVLELTASDGRRQLNLVELDAGDEPGGTAPAPLQKRPIAFADAAIADVPWASISDGPPTADGTPTVVLMTNSNFRDATTVGATLALE